MHFVSAVPDFIINNDYLDRRIDNTSNKCSLWSKSWEKYLDSVNYPVNARNSLKKISCNKNTVCVVTGQQTGLLTSPLLALYKLISAEILSELFTKKTGIPTVPVFWLQTEDHDLEEISSVNFLDQDYNIVEKDFFESFYQSTRIERSSIGELRLEKEFKELLLNFFKDNLHKLPFFDEGFKLVKKCLTEGDDPGKTFAKMLYSLHPNSKTIFIDPRIPEFKIQSHYIYKKVFSNHSEISDILEKQSNDLILNNRPVPVKIRKNSSLFFFHPNGEEGARYRIDFNKNEATIPELNYTISNKDLEIILENEPEKFSSSALLRPLIQDLLLPSVMYVGGPTELNYLEQIRPLYNYFSSAPPLWIPRGKGLFLEEKQANYLNNNNIDAKNFLYDNFNKSEERLREKLILSDSNHKNLSNEISSKISDINSLLKDQIVSKDPTLEQPANKTIFNITKYTNKILKKHENSLIRSSDVEKNRIDKLLKIIYPDQTPQERKISCLWVYLKYGTEGINAIYTNLKNNYKKNYL